MWSRWDRKKSMAQKRRMFSDQITNTDAFLDMSAGAQLLYFHLGIEADDDGFVSSPKMVMRKINSNDDDLKILLLKKFLLPFDGGICVVKHWRINNQIRRDRYYETKYTKEKSKLYIRENGAYTLNPKDAMAVPSGFFSLEDLFLVAKRLPDGSHSIDKSSIDKIREVNTFNDFWGSYPKKTEKKKSELKWNRLTTEERQSILQDIPKRKLGRQWKAGYVPNPLTYLNGERWNDEIETEVTKPKIERLNLN